MKTIATLLISVALLSACGQPVITDNPTTDTVSKPATQQSSSIGMLGHFQVTSLCWQGLVFIGTEAGHITQVMGPVGKPLQCE